LPNVAPCGFNIENGAVRIPLADHLSTDGQTTHLTKALKGLIPWRKGPFQFGPVSIDTEWRSDWKWQRLSPHLSTLEGKSVLDVGCGSGYHLWRMRAAGANCVLGIDPSLLYLMQFRATQHFIQDSQVHFLPLTMDALPPHMACFDTVFSMGILYHRREPHEHLQQLLNALQPGGELIVETLVIPGDDDTSQIVEGRYANMRNIYELPTVPRLTRWLHEAGLESISVPSIDTTSLEEQRSTPWMPGHSLTQALHSDNPDLTVEGYPRPLRAISISYKSKQ